MALGWLMEMVKLLVGMGLEMAKERRMHGGICAPQPSWPHVACVLQPWLLRAFSAPLLSASGGSLGDLQVLAMEREPVTGMAMGLVMAKVMQME